MITVRYLLTGVELAHVTELEAALAVSRLVGHHWLEVTWRDEGWNRIAVVIDGRVAP